MSVTPLFKNVPDADLIVRREAASLAMEKAKQVMIEKEAAYSVALKRYHDTGMYAGLTFAANQHWASIVEYQESVDMHAQFMRDAE